MSGTLPLELHAEALRRRFDASFARPDRVAVDDTEDFLRIRAAGTAWLVAVRALAGLAQGLQLAPFPSAAPAFLGLVERRGKLVPAWSLRQLLGHPPGDDGRWFLLVAARTPLALVCEAWEGLHRVEHRRLLCRPDAGGALSSRSVQFEEETVPVLDLEAAFRWVEQASGRPPSTES